MELVSDQFSLSNNRCGARTAIRCISDHSKPHFSYARAGAFSHYG